MTASEQQQLIHSASVIDNVLASEVCPDLADELAEGRARYTYRPFVDREAREFRGLQQQAGWDAQVRTRAPAARAPLCRHRCRRQAPDARRPRPD